MSIALAFVVVAVALTFLALDRSPAQNEQDGQAHGDCFPFIPEIDAPVLHPQANNRKA